MVGLKNIRKMKNLNQQKVAMDLNISREALSYYENGKREPSLQLLVQMSNYFNVSINYLITGKEFQKRWICLSFDAKVQVHFCLCSINLLKLQIITTQFEI